MYHRGLKLYKAYINNDPGLTLTYFTARSNLIACTFQWGILLLSYLTGKTCSKGLNWLNNTVNEKNYSILPCPAASIHVYDPPFQTSSPLKPLGQSKPNFKLSRLGKKERKFLINGPCHMTKMAAMPIYGKNL